MLCQPLVSDHTKCQACVSLLRSRLLGCHAMHPVTPQKEAAEETKPRWSLTGGGRLRELRPWWVKILPR